MGDHAPREMTVQASGGLDDAICLTEPGLQPEGILDPWANHGQGVVAFYGVRR